MQTNLLSGNFLAQSVPKNLGLPAHFTGRTAGECQAMQADEFSAHPDGAIKGTGS